MTFEEFLQKWQGRGIDFDGYYGDQCMDLIHQYHVDVLGIADGRTLAAPNAKSVFLNFPSVHNNHLFDRIENTPEGVPQKGDIVYWGNGESGHVAIFIEGDAQRFKSFDQNFPTGTKCQIVEHDYAGVLGWLRFKGNDTNYIELDGYKLNFADNASNTELMKLFVAVQKGEFVNKEQFLAQQAATSQCQVQLQTAIDQASEWQNKATELQTWLDSTKTELDELKKKYETELQRVVDLKAENAKILSEDSNYGQEALDAQHQVTDMEKKIEKTAAELELEVHHNPENGKSLVDEILDEIVRKSRLTEPQESRVQFITKLLISAGINRYLPQVGMEPLIENDPKFEEKSGKFIADMVNELITKTPTDTVVSPVAETVKPPRKNYVLLAVTWFLSLFIDQKGVK